MTRPVVGVGGAAILERAGEPHVCLVRRKSPPKRGSWSLPGGKVEGGERLAEAVRRELREETGLEVEVGPLLEVVEILEDGHHYVVLDYACTVQRGELCAGDDALEAAWVPLGELGSYGVSAAVERVAQGAAAALSGGSR